MKIGIVGLGLIGGSLARALSGQSSFCAEVYGFDIDKTVSENALGAGAVNKILEDGGLSELDMLIFAVTPRVFCKILPDYLKKLKPGVIICDISGNKREVVKTMEDFFEKYPEYNFIATHPMAGRESWGFENSTADLFAGASLLYVPVGADGNAASRFLKVFSALGFKDIIKTTADKHDLMIAYTSQLPHAISASYILNPLSLGHDGFSAGSFKDLTRVSRLNSKMWAELFIDNRDNLICAIENFETELATLKTSLQTADEPKLVEFLEKSNKMKNKGSV